MDSFISKFHTLDAWLKNPLILFALIGAGLGVQWVIFRLLKLSNKRKPSLLKAQLLTRLVIPVKILVPLLFVYSSLSVFELSTFWQKCIEAFIIINFTWILIAFLEGLEIVVKDKFEVGGNHKAKDRKVLTQLRFLKSIAFIVIITLAIATILWNIPQVRKIGTTILTSAGVIGIIVGVAAQKSIANLITGFQIAFTQPIKIDDEVVIEGEFGVVEDITLTYVVIKIWDLRRLVLPLSYFNDKPFVNWTFKSKDIIGTVFLYVDYSFPVASLREELMTILNTQPQWDKQTADLLVTKAKQNNIELRASFSAKDASDIWSLRCQVREKLITFIQENYTNNLPRVRFKSMVQKQDV
ncbi:MAG: mechanosensitive ion channel family protein [Mesonia hippocampi]|uniref:mechanosensitive ion channel family protein n=1 Tax=Mesonia hippocampi TaxID=1628250 RepID=UPI003F9AFA39